jgi:excisionase family DNA binding protein
MPSLCCGKGQNGGQPPSMDDFLTVREVATLTLNQQTVRNWIGAGRLPAPRVGRGGGIKGSDLAALVDSGPTAHGRAWLAQPSRRCFHGSRVAPAHAPRKAENPDELVAFHSTATGIRTRVSAVRGRRPSPLDDSGEYGLDS